MKQERPTWLRSLSYHSFLPTKMEKLTQPRAAHPSHTLCAQLNAGLNPDMSAKMCEGGAGGPRTQETLESVYQAAGTKNTACSQDQAPAGTADRPEGTGEGGEVTRVVPRSHHARPSSLSPLLLLPGRRPQGTRRKCLHLWGGGLRPPHADCKPHPCSQSPVSGTQMLQAAAHQRRGPCGPRPWRLHKAGDASDPGRVSSGFDCVGSDSTEDKVKTKKQSMPETLTRYPQPTVPLGCHELFPL